MRRTIGVWTSVALVMGNMIGSGVFLLPSALAPYRGLALLGWLVSATGSMLLAFVLSRLATLHPTSGGPYAYCRTAFGDFAGFLVAWIWWLSLWSGNAAIAVAFVGYLDPFVPALVRNPVSAAALAIAAVWTVALVNVLGVQQAGRLQLLTTTLKVLPLIFVAIAGLWWLAPGDFALPRESAGATAGAALFTTVSLTMWAFTGLESATVPAEHVKEPTRTIPRATVIGTGLTALLYVASTAGVMAILSPDLLAATTAPFAEAARAVGGDAAALLVAGGAAVSTFGALNGWTLLSGQLPAAVARDGLFPAAFARLSRRGTPAQATLIAAALASLLIAANATRGLVGLFTFTILLSTLGALLPYAGCALASVFPAKSGAFRSGEIAAAVRGTGWHRGLALLAFAYTLVAMAGAGGEAIAWGGLALLAGSLLYLSGTRMRSMGPVP